MSGPVLELMGRLMASYLEAPAKSGYEPFTPSEPTALASTLQVGDILLVEGNSRVAAIIKYLTQSTWSHAALYCGDIFGKRTEEGEPHVLLEAELGQGVITAPLSKYRSFHTRICRPYGLADDDRGKVIAFAVERLGLEYDLKNITDLLRLLVPLPLPARLRRRALAIGSGSPTRAICSTLIAQAFESVRYPILPRIELVPSRRKRREILHIRHHSLYTPRDFDISPFFQIIKPTIVAGFDYKIMLWGDRLKHLGPRTRHDAPEEARPMLAAAQPDPA